MKFLLIPLALVAGHAVACPDAKDAMAPADMSVASKTVPNSALSSAMAAKPAPAVTQTRTQQANTSSNRTSASAATRQTKVAIKTPADQAKDKTL
jgi:hypothetical protein